MDSRELFESSQCWLNVVNKYFLHGTFLARLLTFIHTFQLQFKIQAFSKYSYLGDKTKCEVSDANTTYLLVFIWAVLSVRLDRF